VRRTDGQSIKRHGWRLAAAGAVVAALVSVGRVADPGAAAQLQLGPASLLVTGQDTLAFRAQHVSGGEVTRGAYIWDSYASQSGFEHRTDLVVHGEILPNLLVDAAIARGPYAIGRQRLTFTFDGSDAVVKAGDLAVAFDGSALANFRRSLRGIQVDSKLARGALTLVASESKPSVRVEALYGRNSSGPYYLAASPVVDASEAVQVDGRQMRRGTEYSIDYQIGLIQFTPALIIPPTSRIDVSYEYDAPGGQSGNLVGMRALYPITSALRLGATYLTLQRPISGGSSSAIKEDRWQGNSTAGPFTLTYRPIEAGSERVRLDGILQVQGRDYRIDYAMGSIFFLQPVPAGVSVIVTYQVVGAAPQTSGDRSLVGLDTHFSTGRHLNLDMEFAQTVGGAAGSLASSGGAFAFGARGAWDRLTLSANLRQASAAFAPFESADFNQVRSGYDWSLGFEPVQSLHISAAARDYRRPYLPYGATSDMFVRDRTRQLGLDFSRPGWPTLCYTGSWSSLEGLSVNPLAERSGTHIVTLGYERDIYGFKAAYRRNSNSRQGDAPLGLGSVSGSDSPASDGLAFGAYSGRGHGASLSMWYRPSSDLNVVCDLARSGMALAEGGQSTAGSSRLAVDYAPTSRTSISLGYRASSSGDTQSFDGRTVSGYRNRGAMISVRQSLTPDLSVNLAYDRQMSAGGYSTNSDSDAWTGGLFWQPTKSLSLIGQYTRQNLTYLGATGRSANDIMSLGTIVGPFGPGLKLDLSLSRMSGTSSGSFGSSYYGSGTSADSISGSAYDPLSVHGMANSSLRARLTCPVADRQQAFAEWETSTNAGYPGGNRRRALALGWQLEVTRGVNFTVDWRRIASDSADAAYSYRGQTLSGELGFKF
jgi:hypothetical protein